MASSLAPPPTKVADVQFDPDGDVILVLSPKTLIFFSTGNEKRKAQLRVNSTSLGLASPVFLAMFGANRRFKEARALSNRNPSPPPVEISLKDDDPRALALLLRIVHRQYDWVPKTLTDDQLYEVAIVCDKYDMQQVLGLWLDQWLPLNTQAGGNVKGDKWLFIAYTFGREELFRQLSKDLILTCSLGVAGSLVAPGTVASVTLSFNKYLPASVVDEIANRRKLAVTNIFACINRMITGYAYCSGVSLQCAHDYKTNCCDTFFLGFLLNAFKKYRTGFLLDHTSTSIHELRTLVETLKTPDFLIFQGGQICGCSPNQNLTAPHGGSGCRTCGRVRANHASTCSPIPKLRSELDVYFNIIQGLAYKSFASSKNNRGKQAEVVPTGAGLWDYLTYK